MKEPEKIKSEAVTIITIPFRQAFSHLFHIKNIWLLALSMLASHSCMMGMSGFLPLYLRGNGWTTATADGALAIYSGVGALAVIPLTILSDRLGSRKLGLFVAFTVTILGVGLLSIIHNEFVWALVIVSGIFSMLISPLLVTICIETKEIGSAYAGTAIGLINSLSNLGAFISPPLGNSLASISYGLPFVFWAVLAACGLVILNFIKETGWRSQGG